jgi:hypothetical protein
MVRQVGVLLLVGAAIMCFAVDGPLAAERGRPNALEHSYRIWSEGSVRHGTTVTAKTQYGTLSCTGGRIVGPGGGRSCHWVK